jgi:hypothetical protein
VAPPRNTDRQHTARTAVQALHHALRTMREHPEAPALLQTARRHCHRALLQACAERPLVLQLRSGAVHIDGVPVLPFGPGDAPFDALQRAGIGELVLGPDLPPTAVELLLARLAAVRERDEPEVAVRTVIGPEPQPWLQLRAAHGPDQSHTTAAATADWWLLPGPGASARALRAMVDRDLAANLPALATAQLLLDLDQLPPPPDAVLHGLFERLLTGGDLSTAGWLLGEVERQPNVPASVRAKLHGTAAAVTDDAWLRRQLEQASHGELLELATFVLQLGDATAERLAQLASAEPQANGRWLCELLGRSG